MIDRNVETIMLDPCGNLSYARKLVRAFGYKVFDVIEATPDRLREVGGIEPGSRGQHPLRLGRTEGGLVFLHSAP
jgi:hypothetical protein